MFIIAHKEKFSRDVFIPGRRIYMALAVSAMLDRTLFFMLLNFPVIVLAPNKKNSPGNNNLSKAGQFFSK